MDWNEFTSIISAQKAPVILLEGTRSLAEQDISLLTAFAGKLALALPHAVFRSGNAAGADDAFAAGVLSVDPKRLQYILPSKGNRKKFRSPTVCALSLDELSAETINQLAGATVAASPEYASMMKSRHSSRKLTNIAAYLIRDTLKIVGNDVRFPPATFGIFYVNANNPDGGGTGHTIRVCKHYDVPIATQKDWMTWDVAVPDCKESKRVSRMVSKCVRIFSRRIESGRGKSHKFVYNYLERLLTDEPDLIDSIYEDQVIPIVREQHFKGMTMEDFLEQALIIYRGRFGGLEQVWDWLDNEIPFTADEYCDFVEMLEAALAREPNAPTKDDWEELNECLMK